jgi:hypothetical protein
MAGFQAERKKTMAISISTKRFVRKIIPVHGKEHRDVAIHTEPMNTIKDLSAHANRSEMAMTESGVAGGKNMMLSIRNEAEECDCGLLKSQNRVNEKSYCSLR